MPDRKIGTRKVEMAEGVPPPSTLTAVAVTPPWIFMVTPAGLGVVQVMVAKLRGADGPIPVYELVKSYNTTEAALAFVDGALMPKEDE